MVKPKTCMRNTAPISDRGMVTTGMRAERRDPRKRKMITTTMSKVSLRVLTTSWMALSM